MRSYSAQSAKVMEQVDLADSLLGHALSEERNISEIKRHDARGSNVKSSAGLLESSHSLDLPISRSQIVAAQKDDSTLTKCFSAVISSEAAGEKNTAYFMDDGLLMRRWCSKVEEDLDWNVIYQVVVPSKYRSYVFCLAHEHLLSGHLGVTKTYHRILQHFFGLG